MTVYQVTVYCDNLLFQVKHFKEYEAVLHVAGSAVLHATIQIKKDKKHRC